MTLLLLAVLLQVDVKIEPRTALADPKFRMRDGETSLKGSSIFSRELDAESTLISPGLDITAIWGRDTFGAGLWGMTAEGSDTLLTSRNFGGGVFPAGTATDTTADFRHIEVGWRRAYDLTESLRLDAGLDLEYIVFASDLGLGKTRLDGVHPVPQAELAVSPIPDVEVYGGIGGLYLPFKNGDTSIIDPIQYRFGIRVNMDRTTLHLGYDLYHVHLEENSGDVDEDVVHMRLRAILLDVEFRF